jgi:quercetin 2,3-dioxygenase
LREGKQTLSVPTDYNCMIYVIKGELKITGFGNIELATNNGCQFLLLAGKPINETIVQQGPFVMNTQSEILEAMRDYQMGKMGFLVEE